jgi:glycosyltransferase involved in cell wall biosynthesis
VPKVTQEAAACGLPVILFGYFEAPSVVDGENGFVVWDDGQLFNRVAELLGDPERAREMGRNGAHLARNWDWNLLAPQWESTIRNVISGRAQKSGVTK